VTLHQGEKGAEDVTADGASISVEGGLGGENGFSGFEAVFDGEQFAIAQRDLQRQELGAGSEHKETVEVGVGGDLCRGR
jgi:hypothetical protein